ncbi:MAG: VanZ family protein [Acetobacteraceae bacterium]|jgi:glycopeptide antibiotics resistance protein
MTNSSHMGDNPSGQTDTPHPAVAGSPRAYAVVLLLVTMFILYGSLFPFEYREQTYPGGPVGYLLSTWQDWDHRGDLLSNILLYSPFGFFGTLALPSRIAAQRRALVTIVAGIVLSCGIEITQFHDVGRVTSMGDVYANAIGSGIGSLAAASIGASMRWPFVRELAGHPAASLLFVMFFGYRLYPYVPTIDLHKYWHAVRPMLLAPSLPPGELTRFVITWLLIAVVVHALYGFHRFLLLFPLLCGCEFLGKILIIDNALTLTDVVGAGAAFLLWTLLLHRMPARFAILALAFVGMITVQRLQPFQFAATPHGFGWVPLGSFMRDAIGPAIRTFCEDFYEYGGLIWLLGRAGVPLPIGTALTATLLFATDYADCWLAGRSAEITDAVMALGIGGAFALLRHAARRGSGPTGSNTAAAREHARLAEAILAQHGVAPAPPARRGRKHAPYVPPHLRG